MCYQVLQHFSASWPVREGGQRSPVVEEFLVSNHGLSLVQVGHIVQILKDLGLWYFHPNYQKWLVIMSKAAFSFKPCVHPESSGLGQLRLCIQKQALLLETLGWCHHYRDGQGPKGIELKPLKELRASQVGFKGH